MLAHTTTGRWRVGLALALVATLMWGLLPVALKGLLRTLDPTTATWVRFAAAALVLAPFVLLRGGVHPRGGAGRGFLLLLFVATGGLCANYIFYVLGLQHLTPAAAQVVIQLAPMFLLLGSLVVFREPFAPFQWAGVGAFTAGLALFFNRRIEELLVSPGDYALGVALVAIAGLLWAVYSLAQKQLLQSLSSVRVMFLIYVAGTAAFLPFSRPLAILDLDAVGLLLLAFCALNTLVAYGAFSEALEHWDASRVAASLTTVPLVTLVVVEIVDAASPGVLPVEPLNALSVAGALLVVAGSMAASLWRPRARPPAA